MKKIRQDITQSRLLPQMSIEALEAEAIEFLREKCGQSSNIGLAFSGGKDSVVIMELMKRTGLDFTAYYNVTTIDPPEVVKFIRQFHPSVKFSYPKHNFWKKIETSFPPLAYGGRWCCALLKHGKNVTRECNPLVLGIRAEESFRREDYNRWHSTKRQTSIYPAFHWTTADVWEYIEFRNLPYCSLYDEGFDRLGCVPCPYKSPHMHEISKKRWPGLYTAFENSVKRWFAKKVTEGHTMANDSADEFLEDWYHHKAHWYAGQRKELWPK